MNKDLAEFHCGSDSCELKLAIYHTFNIKYVQQTEALANSPVTASQFPFVSPQSSHVIPNNRNRHLIAS